MLFQMAHKERRFVEFQDSEMPTRKLNELTVCVPQLLTSGCVTYIRYRYRIRNVYPKSFQNCPLTAVGEITTLSCNDVHTDHNYSCTDPRTFHSYLERKEEKKYFSVFSATLVYFRNVWQPKLLIQDV